MRRMRTFGLSSHRGILLAVLLAVAAAGSGQTWTDNGATSSTTDSIGIGTATPSTRLTVFGSGAFNSLGAAQINLSNGASGITFGQHVNDGGVWHLSDASGPMKISVIHGANGPIGFYNGTGNVIVHGSGSVGIGTTSPLRQFSVGNGMAGSIQTYEIGNFIGDTVGTFVFDPNSANIDHKQTHPSVGVFRWLYGTTERMRLARDGSLGLGTVPADRVHIRDGNLRIEQSNPAATLSALVFYEGAQLYGFVNQRGSQHPTEPRQFNIGNNALNGATSIWAGGYPRLTVASDGRVGVGAPPAAGLILNVAGDAHFTGTVTGGNIAAKFQDIAEWVPTTEALRPGTVVVLDAARKDHVRASSEAYDTAVAGVVSAEPGLILGEGDASKAMVATTGRVRVRVDATEAPIAIGDLLTTSDVPGTAMRSEGMAINGRRFHQPGTIIGKALEPLERGTGEILVLLSMQ